MLIPPSREASLRRRYIGDGSAAFLLLVVDNLNALILGLLDYCSLLCWHDASHMVPRTARTCDWQVLGKDEGHGLGRQFPQSCYDSLTLGEYS